MPSISSSVLCYHNFKNVWSDLLLPGKFITICSHLNVRQHLTTCHLLYKEMGPIRREKIIKKENSENVLLKAGITVFNSKDITTETLFLPSKLCRLTCCGHQDPCLKN